MLSSTKLSTVDLHKKLISRGWKGRYFGHSNCVTYLRDNNETIAVVVYDNRRSLIVTADFK